MPLVYSHDVFAVSVSILGTLAIIQSAMEVPTVVLVVSAAEVCRVLSLSTPSPTQPAVVPPRVTVARQASTSFVMLLFTGSTPLRFKELRPGVCARRRVGYLA